MRHWPLLIHWFNDLRQRAPLSCPATMLKFRVCGRAFLGRLKSQVLRAFFGFSRDIFFFGVGDSIGGSKLTTKSATNESLKENQYPLLCGEGRRLDPVLLPFETAPLLA